MALELLTKPSLIFLDEPTSGLDPGMDRDVMQLLRGLADDGRTVLVVTHSVAELGLCDKLLVTAPGGSVAYFGPPDEALNFFGYETWADVFSAFENYRDYDWAGRWKGSQHYQLYAADIDAVAAQPVQMPVQSAARPPKPQSWGAQLWTLIRRYVSVIASDRGFLALMVILPAVLGAVSVVIPAKFGLAPPTPPSRFNGAAGTIMLILAVGMCFSGAANSVRELIKERVIYERERATGLSLLRVPDVQGDRPGRHHRPPGRHHLRHRLHPARDARRGPAHAAGRRAVHRRHRPGHHLDDGGPRHLLAGQDRREDHAAAGHVRDRAGGVHRHPVPGVQLAGPGAVRLAHAVPLGPLPAPPRRWTCRT